MSPQFVDFNADGHLDIVAGTFDGSPHVAFGDGKGWQQPVQILDVHGERIMLNEFWNFDTKKWDSTTRFDAKGSGENKGHCTSAVAIDWDGDGDLDLLLGDHRSGHVYRRMNEGTAAKPAFGALNLPVLAGGKPLDVPGTVATMRLVDWNRDGLTDLVCGGMGDAYEDGEGGGVYLCCNSGSKTEPAFAAPVVLVPASPKAAIDGPTRPDSGIYMDVVDYEGDGDLDLIVGGYSHWTPKAPVLTAGQQQKVVALRAKLKQLTASLRSLLDAAQAATKGLDEAAAAAKRLEVLATQKDERAAISKKQASLTAELDKLAPGPQRRSFVWIYANQTVTLKN